MKKSIAAFACLLITLMAWAANPMATTYTYEQCQGSLSPYHANFKRTPVPDSLEAVMINHVGRHGSRYPASATNCNTMLRALQRADSARTITPLGRDLMALVKRVIKLSENQWGALDSLGMSEQRGIASRMYRTFPRLMADATVVAMSSYSPRCMMSMYAFTHQLDRLHNHMEFYTSTGRQNDVLLRPFDIDQDYIDLRRGSEITDAYNAYFAETCPTTAIDRVLGARYPFANADEQRDLAITEYYVMAGLECMSVKADPSKYFTVEEYNALWSCFNLRQYLQRTASTISAIPAEIAAPLLVDLVKSTQDFIDGKSTDAVVLRFGHAETLMPLLSLMRMPGCYYMTNYFDTVAQHWRDFYVVPMASNLQMILLKDKDGKHYVRLDLNEVPVPFMPGSDQIYVPWTQAKQFFDRCIPLYAQ